MDVTAGIDLGERGASPGRRRRRWSRDRAAPDRTRRGGVERPLPAPRRGGCRPGRARATGRPRRRPAARRPGSRSCRSTPIRLAAARDRYRAAGGKSDGFDAYVLAELARTDMHRLRALEPDADETRALRALTRARDGPRRDSGSRSANQLRAQLEAFWPGAAGVFADVDSPIALAFLERYPAPPTPAASARSGSPPSSPATATPAGAVPAELHRAAALRRAGARGRARSRGPPCDRARPGRRAATARRADPGAYERDPRPARRAPRRSDLPSRSSAIPRP